jgi:hypothetical protein
MAQQLREACPWDKAPRYLIHVPYRDGASVTTLSSKWGLHYPKLVSLAAEGLSNEVIAARLDTPRQIISKWRKRFFDQRLAGLEEEPRGGQAARFSPQRRR